MSGFTPIVLAHVTAASLALALGPHQLFGKQRGGIVHQLVGRVWVILILFTAVSSFAIRDINPGGFSLLHALSIVTLLTTGLGVRAIRRGNVDRHRANMIGTYLGLLGAFTAAVAVPSRLLPRFAVADPLSALGAVALVAVLTIAVTSIARRLVGTGMTDERVVSDGSAGRK